MRIVVCVLFSRGAAYIVVGFGPLAVILGVPARHCGFACLELC